MDYWLLLLLLVLFADYCSGLREVAVLALSFLAVDYYYDFY